MIEGPFEESFEQQSTVDNSRNEYCFAQKPCEKHPHGKKEEEQRQRVEDAAVVEKTKMSARNVAFGKSHAPVWFDPLVFFSKRMSSERLCEGCLATRKWSPRTMCGTT